MVFCRPSFTKEQKEQMLVSKHIDLKAAAEYRQIDNSVKVLLLGPGESGKSTILKQIHSIFNNGFDDDERRGFVPIVRENLFTAIKTLLEMTDVLAERGLKGTKISKKSEAIKNEILNFCSVEEVTDWKKFCNKTSKLWTEEKGLKVVYENRSMYHLTGSGDYFIRKAVSIGSSEYVPTILDVMSARIKTTGISEKFFKIGSNGFRVFDVGGQRNQRNKWIHCFEDVDGVVFVISLVGYDEFCVEDSSTKQMTEALNLFEDIVNSRYFRETNIYLFLNKTDLFKHRMKKKPLTTMFKDYEDGADIAKALEFVKKKFMERAGGNASLISCHFTCATDQNGIKEAIQSVMSKTAKRRRISK